MKPSLFMLLLFTAHAHAGETETVFNRVRDSVVTLTVYDERREVDGAGSGVVTAPGRVITNCHVVQEAVAIRVRAGDKEWDATVALADSARDLCQLEVPGLTAPAAKIRSYREVQIGEPIYAVGNPLGFGLAVSAGLVSSIAQHKGELRLFSSAPISPGSSGGGLFDSRGRLIGITTGFYSGAQNFNLALPADWVAELPARGVPKAVVPASTPDPDWPGQSESHRVAGEWTKLAAWSRRWREAYPTSALAGSYLGLALLKLQQAEEAKQALLVSLQNDPRHATAYAYLAETRNFLGEKQAALVDLQNALMLSPATGYLYFTRAVWQRDGGDIPGAFESIQTALKFEPGNEFNWEVLANLHQRQQRFTEAVQGYRTVLRLKPNHPLATANLALSLAALGENSAARQTLMTATPTGLPIDAVAWLTVGLAEEKQGHFVEAERAYRKALEINPALADAWNSLGIFLLRTTRNTEAEEALRQAIKHKPNMAMAWMALGEMIKRRGDKTSAKEAYEKATMIDPLLASAWYELGVARRELGDYVGAATALEQAVRLDPKSPAWAILGEMQLRTGHSDAALKSLQEAEKLNPKDEFALQAFSMYYGKSGDQNKSLAYALRSLEVNAATALNWNNKGYSLVKLQRYPEAITALETATRLQPDLIPAWVNLGESYLHAKQLGKAIPTLEQALKLAPTAADARLFIAQAYMASGLPAKSREHLSQLLRQQPKLAPAWAMMTLVSLSQGNKPEALAAYNELKLINSVMARNLSAAYRKQNPLSSIVLPY